MSGHLRDKMMMSHQLLLFFENYLPDAFCHLTNHSPKLSKLGIPIKVFILGVHLEEAIVEREGLTNPGATSCTRHLGTTPQPSRQSNARGSSACFLRRIWAQIQHERFRFSMRCVACFQEGSGTSAKCISMTHLKSKDRPGMNRT